MVVQCSLLGFVHEKSSLAAAIAHICEREAENVGKDQAPRTVPSHEGLYGVLQACEDQTSSYNWNGPLLATARALDITEDDALTPIPSTVFQGAVLVFPMVQRFPEDRIVLIDASVDAGACSLVVWANLVLGLNVLVRKDGLHNQLLEKQFGLGTNHVVIDLRDRSLSWIGDQSTLEIKQPSITLLSVSDNEILLTLRPEPDETPIDANYKRSAGGFGKRILEVECAACDDEEGRDVFARELTLLVITFALIISQRLSAKPPAVYRVRRCSQRDILWLTCYLYLAYCGLLVGKKCQEMLNAAERQSMVSEQALTSSARFLFTSPRFNLKSIEGHVLAFSRRSLDANFQMPHTISLLFDRYPPRNLKKETLWHDMLEKVRYLSVVVLAFAFVKDLDGCAELPLSQSLNVLGQHNLLVQLNSWDGISQLWIPEDCWFLVLARLLIGHKTAIDTASTCLVSDRGWSVFSSTFGDADPTFTVAGHIVIKKGVPCRNSVWKHSIKDGPPGTWANEWHIVNSVEAKESLRCVDTVYRSKPLCGDRHGSFLVTVRLSTEVPPQPGQHKRTGWKEDTPREVESRRTGYRELFAAIWGLQHTRSCQHQDAEIMLPLSCVSVSGFGDLQMQALKNTARIFICLTAKNSAARWRALIAIHMNSHVFPNIDMIHQVMLRGEDCCFQCAVDQTLVQAGYWFLVL